MVDSGIKMHQTVFDMYTDGFATRTKQKYDYLILDILKKEGKKHDEIYVTSAPEVNHSATQYADVDTGKSTKEWYAFAKELKESKQPKFGLCYLDFKTKDGNSTSKMVFIHWSDDDTATPSKKMKFSSTKISLTKKLGGGFVEHPTVSDESALDFVTVVKEISKQNCSF